MQTSNDYKSRVKQGMKVVGSDANELGCVRECRADTFIVDCEGGGEVPVAFSHIKTIKGDTIELTIPAAPMGAAPADEARHDFQAQ